MEEVEPDKIGEDLTDKEYRITVMEEAGATGTSEPGASPACRDASGDGDDQGRPARGNCEETVGPTTTEP